MIALTPEPLTREAFAPFGDVLETEGAHSFPINSGTTTRFHALSRVDVDDGGQAILSIFRATARPMPIAITMLERHPLGSQAFMPLFDHDWLIVVAETVETEALRCFRATGLQGVQYGANVWHHPLLVLIPEQDFLVVDRMGEGSNLEETDLMIPAQIKL